MIRKGLAGLLLLMPGMAGAAWHRVESSNYIAYSEGSEDDLKKRVVDLEKFGAVLQAMTGARRLQQQPVRIKIFFLSTPQAVQDSMPFEYGNVLGYYNTVKRGPFAVMPRVGYAEDRGFGQRRSGLDADTVLRHELTHHFTFQYFPRAYPQWYTEGFADYMGAIRVSDDNVATVGAFLNERAEALRRDEWVPLAKLMNPPLRDPNFNGFAFYSEGWITVHYLSKDDAGRKLLRAYLGRINSGATFAEAIKAFGDIDDLDAKVRAYARLNNLPGTAVRYASLDTGPIRVVPLTPAEEAMVDVDLKLHGGVARKNVDSFARQVRGIAGRFPDDPYALRMLADVERFAGNTAEARAVIDRWLAAHPQDPWALFMKGDMETEALAAAKSTDDAAWKAARARIAAAIRLEPNEPRMKQAYYESYARRGVLPPDDAQNQLAEALDMVPRYTDLRMEVARDYEARGLIDDAIDTIGPVAYGLADEDEKAKRERKREEKEYALAEDDNGETPRELLVRLLGKKTAAAKGAPPRAAAKSGS